MKHFPNYAGMYRFKGKFVKKDKDKALRGL